MEYVLVLPSLNGHLKSINVESSWVGTCIAMVNLAALVTATPIGKTADFLQSSRLMGVFAISCSLAGNLVYICVPSLPFIIISRILSGIGSGLEPILFGFLGRSCASKDRSAVFSRHMLAREMGIIFGPALNLAYNSIDFTLYCYRDCPEESGANSLQFFKQNSTCVNSPTPSGCDDDLIRINEFNMPALFLSCSWTVLLFLFLVYYQEPVSPVEGSSTESLPPAEGFELPSTEDSGLSPKTAHNHTNDGSALMESIRSLIDNPYTSLTVSNHSLGASQRKRSEKESIKPSSPLLESEETDVISNSRSSSSPGEFSVLTEQFVVIMMSSFCVMFLESAMEASLTPMTFKFFQWETQQNSLCYVYLGVCCLFGYIALMVLQGHSKIKLMDRTALLIGALGVGAAQLIGFCTFPLGYYGAPWIFPVFMGVLALCLATLPFMLVPPASLMSKSVPQDKQATLQAVRMSFQKIAMVLGPLWGTHTLWNYYVMMAAPLLMAIIVTVLIICSYKYLKDERLVQPSIPAPVSL